MKKICLALILLSGLLAASEIKPVHNKLFLKECGSCHFAYQPGLLPQRSWKKMMHNLGNHFGVDASLDKKVNHELLNYLVKNSSDHSKYYLSRVMTKYIRSNEIPLRITKTRVFRSAHDEVRRSLFNRKSVGSASNCATCHTSASRGSYSEDYVRIPR